MKNRTALLLTIVLAVLVTLVLSTPGYSQSPTAEGVQRLKQDAGSEVEITWNPQTGVASFVRAHIPLVAAGLRSPAVPATAAVTVIERYAGLFGVKQAAGELRVVQTDRDELGMTHVTQAQLYQGVEVYGALVKVHLGADGREVVAISSGFIPGIQLSEVRPRVSVEQALATARRDLPNGILLSSPKLMVYPGQGKTPGASAKLAWLVELRDDAVPARNVYVVDALTGGMVDVLNRLYDGNQISTLPGRERSIDDQVLSKIAPQVLALTENGAAAEFFIVLSDQADLSHAGQLQTKTEKGRYVYQTLWDKAQSSQAPIKTWLDSQNVQYQSFYIVNALLVKGERALVLRAAARSDVWRIEANPKVNGLNDESSDSLMQFEADASQPATNLETIEPNIRYVRAPGIWALGYTGQGVVVGGQDTGYDWDHPALKSKYRGWNGSTVSHDYNWHDSIHSGTSACGTESPIPCDAKKHGTHTMGTVLGSEGTTNQIGTAPGAKWIGCRNMDDQGKGSPATYLECFQFFLAPYPVGGTPAQGRPDLAPDVTVNSWGCPTSEGCSWSTLQSAVQAQRAAGILTVASAGNSGSGCSTVTDPPALYDEVYTVGAWNMTTNSLAGFSSRGPVTIDGSYRLKPDITAPGTNIRSSVPGGGYEQSGWQGTSMAGPHVAGAVALLWSAKPALLGQVDLTRTYLSINAIHITSNECLSSVGWPNNSYGYGRLDSLAVVRYAMSLSGGHRYRETYSANHGTNLPGTLMRSENDPATGDADVDNAHDFAGTTYDYFKNTHSRDSYDNQGASIISTAHYGRNYQNAFWNGTQMVYGDNFPVNDVVAHELTHAVTERTANLEYRWQFGALNESISDIFGAMVDRDDWLMGEDLPASALGGRDAIRDMANPQRLGQPDNVSGWVKTCSDNEGVHTNSGIANKAYYNIATAITKDKAERIIYRVLTVYLSATSSLEDFRASAIQSAADLYGGTGTEYQAVINAFNAVGLDGTWNPPTNDCSCGASVALTDLAANPDPAMVMQTLTTLYRVRNQFLNRSAAGQRYRVLYEQNTMRISYLLLLDASLRADGSRVLEQVAPGLDHLISGQGNQIVVTREMVDNATAFLQQLARNDRARGGGDLARTIEQELARVDKGKLVGMTFDQAWGYLNSLNSTGSTIYAPIIMK